jgi:hypothetical protein
MLTWLDGRNASTFSSLNWNGNTLSFSIIVGQGANGLMAMVPVAAGQVVAGIMYNGSPVAYALETVKGVQYAVFFGAEGAYQIDYTDIVPPDVSTFTATSPSTSLNIPITAFTATDNVGVTGYMITTSSAPPTAGTGGWSGTSPTTYTVASDGTYTLYPWAMDAADNVSAVFGSPRTVVVDATPPNAPTVSGTTPTNDTTPTWTWTPGGGGNGTYRYKLDDSNLGSGATTTTGTSYTPVSALTSNATHTFYVQERDAAGNWSASGSFAIVIDITPPNAPSVSGATPTNDTTPTWTWTPGGGGGNGTYRYKLDDSNLSSGATTTTGTSYIPVSALPDATHTLYVQERDAAGNWSAIGSFAIVINTTLPPAPAVSGMTPTNDTTPTWAWTPGGGGNGTYRYKLDDSNLSSGATTTTNTSYTPVSALPDATHTLYVQERDAAGNWSAAGSFAIVIDTIAPTVVISAPSLVVTKSGPVTYTVIYTGATNTVTLATGNVTVNKTGTADGTIAVTGSGTSTRTVTLSNITGNGTLGISIAANTASDLAGNTAGAAGPGTTFTVDNADGDLNGDSTVNMIDALKALRIAAGLDTPTASEGGHGDVAPLVGGQRQPDGTIDLGDVVAILRKAALLPSW